VPFYFKGDDGPRWDAGSITETWLTSIEVEQLMLEGWRVEVLEGYAWGESFSMVGFVDRLEHLRMTAPGGPKGAQGLIIKCLGNNSYGKTAEQLDAIEYVMARERPAGFHEYRGPDELDGLDEFIWFRFQTPLLREYHQPQLGAFITAHVRMVLRRAALLAPAAWLYADTDCLVFAKPVALDIHPSRYGAWKVEEEGAEYMLIAKKVYSSGDGETRHAKGLNVSRLAVPQFVAWLEGRPPEQLQVQRVSFARHLSGEPMFRELKKRGEKPAKKAA
jgi:hypothetical protein